MYRWARCYRVVILSRGRVRVAVVCYVYGSGSKNALPDYLNLRFDSDYYNDTGTSFESMCGTNCTTTPSSDWSNDTTETMNTSDITSTSKLTLSATLGIHHHYHHIIIIMTIIISLLIIATTCRVVLLLAWYTD